MSKKKTKKTKPKAPRERQQSERKAHQKPISDASGIARNSSSRVAAPNAILLPTPTPPPSVAPELEAIRSVLKESEGVLEKLQRLEQNMSKELEQRAKELYEKEFKLPEHKTILCQPEMKACLECYKEYVNDPLKCASVVSSFRECVSKARRQAKVPS